MTDPKTFTGPEDDPEWGMADQQFGACDRCKQRAFLWAAVPAFPEMPPLYEEKICSACADLDVTRAVLGAPRGGPEYLAAKIARYEHVTSDPAAVEALKRPCAACGHERGQHANGLAGVCDPFCYTCRDNGNECKCFTLTASL